MLVPQAEKSRGGRGRLKPEAPAPIRPAFQRDRDRIIHTKAFRRLKHKTQVFFAPTGDHYRTRLTHTLEVSQIARTMAKSLRLNEELTEAISLGHDLGHTPFGHAGEAVLDEIYPGGFNHYEQSLRVVDFIERDGHGLNLTKEVRDGILTHSKRINTMVSSIIYSSLDNSLAEITMGKDILSLTEELRSFLYKNVYENETTHREFLKAEKILKDLYLYYLEHPNEVFSEIPKERLGDNTERLVCDFIAGMTDRYALMTYERLFLPQPWLVM